MSALLALSSKAQFESQANKNKANGYAGLNATGKVDTVRVPLLHFNKITNKPTTLNGYGITDALTTTGSLNWANVINRPTTIDGYGITGGSISGTAGSGFIGYVAQSSVPTAPSSGFRLFARSTNALAWIGANGFWREFDGTANNQNTTYTLQNFSGAVPLQTGVNFTSGSIPFYNSIGQLAQSNGQIFWDATNNRLGVRTNSPGYALDVRALSRIDGGIVSTGSDMALATTSANSINFSTNNVEAARIHSSGNFLIGTSTNSGFKFDVSGSSRLNGNTTFGTNSIFDNTNTRLGLGNTNPLTGLHLSGGSNAAIRINTSLAANETNFLSYIIDAANTNQQGGFFAVSTNGSVAPDLLGSIGFKFEGGSNNAARQCQIKVGSTTPSININGSGNVAIGYGVTAGAHLLDVNGTTRLVGKLIQPTTANSPMGSATLVNGVVTVNNTQATTGCYIAIRYRTGTTPSTTTSTLVVTAINTGVGFTITAFQAGSVTTNTSDNNAVEYHIFN